MAEPPRFSSPWRPGQHRRALVMLGALAPRLCVLPFRTVCSEHGPAVARRDPPALIDSRNGANNVHEVSPLDLAWACAEAMNERGRSLQEAMWTLHSSGDQIARTRVFKKNRPPEKLGVDARRKEQIVCLIRREIIEFGASAGPTLSRSWERLLEPMRTRVWPMWYEEGADTLELMKLRGAECVGLVRIEVVRALAAELWLAPQGLSFCNAMTQTFLQPGFLEDAQPDLFRLDPRRSWLPTARRFTPSHAKLSTFYGWDSRCANPLPTLRSSVGSAGRGAGILPA